MFRAVVWAFGIELLPMLVPLRERERSGKGKMYLVINKSVPIVNKNNFSLFGLDQIMTILDFQQRKCSKLRNKTK